MSLEAALGSVNHLARHIEPNDTGARARNPIERVAAGSQQGIKPTAISKTGDLLTLTMPEQILSRASGSGLTVANFEAAMIGGGEQGRRGAGLTLCTITQGSRVRLTRRKSAPFTAGLPSGWNC